ncbi:MAG: bifunctional adenosylcobinamide kinase/adenosylcobinamide-phosphate guanylyltransferase [Clostridia bacterium]|nr:bifunctional adenosylcobinamide kinase/adenosylcobinamide-phosphate guanylyltransferase [Clostridia bacterium]
MSTFISGGCKNGKSYYAQHIAKAAGTPLYYIATMIPHDSEDDARIVRHQQERDGWGFETLECGSDILSCLDHADANGSFLLDSVTALLSNEMFAPDGFHPEAAEKIADELCEFVRRAPNTVLVSDFIYSDAALYDEWTETYRKGLAHIDRALAKACDCVIEVVNGQKIVYKGELP